MKKLIVFTLLLFIWNSTQSQIADVVQDKIVFRYVNPTPVTIHNDYIMIGTKKFRRKILSQRKFVYKSETYTVSNTLNGFQLKSKKRIYTVKGTKFSEKKINRGKITKGVLIGISTLLGVSAILKK